MTGLGADELFGGYSTFRRVPLVWALNAVPSQALRRRVLRSGKGNQAKAAALAAAGSDVDRIHEELRSVFTRPEIQRLTGQAWAPDPIPVGISKVMDSVTRLEIDRYMRNTLLRDADVFSMTHSLELRTPFVDHLVLESALSVSNLTRARLRKRLLAVAVGNPRITELITRPKRGFRLPMDDWLNGALAGRVADLEHGPLAGVCDRREIVTHVQEWASGRAHHSKIWTLVVLDAWLRRQGQAGR
jgi:asparagine synthase (glutamine-hydrolysing)